MSKRMQLILAAPIGNGQKVVWTTNGTVQPDRTWGSPWEIDKCTTPAYFKECMTTQNAWFGYYSGTTFEVAVSTIGNTNYRLLIVTIPDVLDANTLAMTYYHGGVAYEAQVIERVNPVDVSVSELAAVRQTVKAIADAYKR